MATSKKKPTAAQLAARKLFAQRAKAGTLKAKNPKRPSQATGKRPSARLIDRRERAIPGYFPNPIDDERESSRARRLKEAEKRGDWETANAIRFVMSQRKTKAAPKRKKNPIIPGTQKTGRIIHHFRYVVETAKSQTSKWTVVAGFVMYADAEQYAKALQPAMPGLWIKVGDCE